MNETEFGEFESLLEKLAQFGVIQRNNATGAYSARRLSGESS